VANGGEKEMRRIPFIARTIAVVRPGAARRGDEFERDTIFNETCGFPTHLHGQRSAEPGAAIFARRFHRDRRCVARGIVRNGQGARNAQAVLGRGVRPECRAGHDRAECF